MEPHPGTTCSTTGLCAETMSLTVLDEASSAGERPPKYDSMGGAIFLIENTALKERPWMLSVTQTLMTNPQSILIVVENDRNTKTWLRLKKISLERKAESRTKSN